MLPSRSKSTFVTVTSVPPPTVGGEARTVRSAATKVAAVNCLDVLVCLVSGKPGLPSAAGKLALEQTNLRANLRNRSGEDF